MNLFTHSGIFHADDIFSTALLALVARKESNEIKIFRGAKYLKDMVEGDISYDIETSLYNYKDKVQTRCDGSILATFGLLWKKYGSMFLKRPDVFDEIFVQYIDRTEVTNVPNFLTDVISAFNPSYDKLDKVDEYFKDAIEVALIIIQKELEKLEAIEKMEDELLSSEIDDGILILNNYVPYKEYLDILEKDITFVIYPYITSSEVNGYICSAVEDEKGNLKIPFEDDKKMKIVRNKDEAITVCKMARTVYNAAAV